MLLLRSAQEWHAKIIRRCFVLLANGDFILIKIINSYKVTHFFLTETPAKLI